jgi:hypothetical protein
MSRKIDRALRGPSWVEVVLGALISLVLGVLIGAALLVFRPVTIVKEMPKEDARVPGAVYFVEGSRETSKGRDAPAKRKAFVEGQTVTVIEDELNVLVGPATSFAAAGAPGAPTAPKAPEKKDGKAGASEATADDMIFAGTPNFRLRDNVMQVGIPVTLNVLGLSEKVVVQTRGGFAKRGDVFVYEPGEFYIGSLPVTRLPMVVDYAREKFLSSQPIPEDIKAAWPKLTNVSVEGNVLKLTMP